MEINISYFAILAFAAQKCLPLINGIYKSSITFKGGVPMVFDTLNILDDTKFNLRSLDDAIENKQPIHFKKKIKIEKIKYQYSKDLPFILNNVNFEINKGDKIAIKGKTGTGKSTLINIIIGLLNPTEGKLIVDDIEINEDNQIAWQKNISIVPQSIFLNNATILENIAIAEDPKEINLEKVKQSAKIAQIDSFIESLPNKYNEKVGERGVKLSGGQRQRLGIARALYRNANLIILDEPTNALDTETEKKVMDSITNLEVTIIMISHSDTSLKYFNKVIDLND
jgi:ATP-binding cassette subfamily B protein